MKNEPPAPTTPQYAEWMATYLRRASASETMQRYKQRSYELIEACPGARILDVGCGLGADVAALAAIVGPQGNVVGVDHDPEMLRRAEADVVLPNVRFVRADARALPFEASAFDGARIDRVLQHTGDAVKIISETARVLRSGGRVVAIEPDYGTLAIDLPDRALVRKVLDARTDAYADGWAGRGLLRSFHEAGLRDLAVEPFVVVNTDFATANRAMNMDRADDLASRRHAIGPAEAAEWRDMVARASTAPTFVSVITLFVVVGTRQ